MAGDGYTPAGGLALKLGCVTTVVAAIPLLPIALIGAAMARCAPGASCIGNHWFVPIAILICALLGLAVGGLVHAVTRKRGD